MPLDPTQPVLVAVARSPFGRFGGALSATRPDDLAATVIQAVLERAGVEAPEVNDVIVGCANQAGEDSRNVARAAVLLAGLPVSVPGETVNRLCGSGMQAIVHAAREIQCGASSIIVAGGVESMSRAPLVMARPRRAFPQGTQSIEDSTLGWRFLNPKMAALYGTASLGETAELVAERHHVSRQAQDELALRSHRLAVAAAADGRLAEELVGVPVEAPRSAPTVVDADEMPRANADLDTLAALRTVFRSEGTVTAGNSSPLSDGAAMVVLMSAEEAARRELPVIARFVDAAVAGVEPSYMGEGPIPATRKLLSRPGMPAIDKIDLVELNEAFAAQAVACIRALELDDERVNVNGGAIALGHPLGASGARLVGTLALEMHRRQVRYGLASMCIGVGQGISSLWECPA